jgi:membrane-associated phospholipid phosphatase
MRATPKAVFTAMLALLLGAGPGMGRADETVSDDPVAAEVPPPASSVGSDPRPRLTLDFSTNGWLTGGMLVGVGVAQLYSKELAPKACRWCEPPQFDRWARHQLVWKDTKAATLYGNLLIVAVPVAATLTLSLMAHADGAGFREGAEDILMMTEAVAISLTLMQVAKFTVARTRPDAWAGSGSVTANSRMSFFAGHSSTPFAIAAAGTQLLRMRGRSGWKWFAAVSFVGAAATGLFRVSSDNHWMTDVIAGAAIGTAVGFSVPLLVLHPASERSAGVTLVPAPGGLALVF